MKLIITQTLKKLIKPITIASIAVMAAFAAFLVIGSTIAIVNYTHEYNVSLQNFIHIEPKEQATLTVKK